MAQPPYGPGPEEQPPGLYPRQELLPQTVQPGRSRRPLVFAAVALVVVLAGVLVLLRVMHNSGEQTREAYCAALKTVTKNGDLGAAFAGASQDTTARLSRVRDLAPDGVKGEWDDLFALASDLPSGDPDLGQAARAVIDLKTIIDDANANCGMSIQLPF